MAHAFHVVDVFAERPYGGNQLAVILDAGDLSSERMQAIALETNYSETTFVTSGERAGGAWDVRIFTPAFELPFAGHPTLGTAWVIREHVARARPDRVTLNLGVGTVPVGFERDAHGEERAWLTAPPVTLGRTFDAVPAAAALRLTKLDIDTRGPVQHVSAGITMLVVPVRSLAALRRARLDLDAFGPIAESGVEPIVYVFCTEARADDNQISARLFFDAHGVREDPATGSAAACLGVYLLEHQYLGRGDLALRIEQGHEIGRPSLLLLRAGDAGGVRVVTVGGRVIPTLIGRLLDDSDRT